MSRRPSVLRRAPWILALGLAAIVGIGCPGDEGDEVLDMGFPFDLRVYNAHAAGAIGVITTKIGGSASNNVTVLPNTQTSIARNGEVGEQFRIDATTTGAGAVTGSVTCVVGPSMELDPANPQDTGFGLVVVSDGAGGLSLECNMNWQSPAP